MDIIHLNLIHGFKKGSHRTKEQEAINSRFFNFIIINGGTRVKTIFRIFHNIV